MAKEMLGTTDFDVRSSDLLWLSINTFDNRVDDLIGIRPLRPLGRVLTALAPGNLVAELTELEKPSGIIEKKMDELERDLAAKKLGKPF